MPNSITTHKFAQMQHAEYEASAARYPGTSESKAKNGQGTILREVATTGTLLLMMLLFVMMAI